MTQSRRSFIRLLIESEALITTELKQLNDLLDQSIELINQAADLVVPSGIEPGKQSLKLLGLAIGELLNVKKLVYDKDNSLRPPPVDS